MVSVGGDLHGSSKNAKYRDGPTGQSTGVAENLSQFPKPDTFVVPEG